MRLFLIFLIQILFLNCLQAQIYDIQWNQNLVNHSIGQRTFQVLEIENDLSFNDDKNLPHFYANELVGGKTDLKFTILSQKTLNQNQIGDIQVADIPTQPTFTVAIQKSGQQYRKVIDVVGLYKDGKEIKQILSFKVESNENSISYKKQKFKGFNRINPVLSTENGTFYKISIDTTGIYKIDKNFLNAQGLSINFNPKNFKIYGNGGMMLPENPGDFRYQGLQEIAIHAVGEEDGIFDDTDYFVFYAQGPNGINRNSNGEHAKNLYADKAYYFIQFDGTTLGKRIQSQSVTGNSSSVFTEFDQVLFYENDSINLYNVGRQWVGKSFFNENNFNITFDGVGEVISPIITYRMTGVSAVNNTFTFSINGNTIVQDKFNGGALENRFGKQEFQNIQYPIKVTVAANNQLNPAAGIYLDYFRLNFKQKLNFNQNQLGFRWFQDLIPGATYTFNLTGNPEMVWDVSDRTNISSLEPVNNNYKFIAKTEAFPNEFIAFNFNQAFTPEFVEKIQPQALTALSNIDYVIVTYPDFISQAQRLANAHAKVSGVKTAVVTTEQVYNEFSSGSQDIVAIRDFFKYLYDTGTLRYALLLGDASYDYKDRIPNNTNRVPSYQSEYSMGIANTYVTDDFYAILDDEDRGLNLSQLDIAVGRLPADNIYEATVMIDKTLAYLNQNPNVGSPFGDWRAKVTFVVDDDNPGKGNAFHTTVEQKSAQYLEQQYPFYTIKKLYADVFQQMGTSGGLRYPELEKSIVNTIESGTLLLNYFGHGGINGWAQERIFTQNEIQNLSNISREYARLPILLTVTCDFTVWDIPQIISGGELLIKNDKGGAVAMLTTSREIPVSYGLNMNDIIIKNLFTIQGNEYLPIGDALKQSKIEYSANAGLKLNLIGDPLISLARPQKKVEIQKINGQDAAAFNQTIRALDFVTIEGAVLNDKGTATDTSFNGTVSGTLYDKPETRTTLNNDGNIDVLTFEEQTNAIYRGNSKVQNGNFKFEFYVPKDINFDIGNGKMLFYVENGKTDGVGYKDDITVGDINPNGVEDNQGPVVGLYMNNLNFVDGGITDRNPYLLACVTDSTGINATGAGIGHDITQRLDENLNSTTVLNDFFEGGDASPCSNPNVKDFQKGRVLYKLNNLDLGEHTITFRIWDINNNSTTQTLTFVVMENGDQQLHINRLLNWPNPFTTQTYFHFEHNCPDVLEVQVQVFTVSGKLVKTIRQTVSSAPFREGYRTDKFGIPWDGLDDYGNKIGKGVYIYKTTVKGSNGESCKGTASGTEKLVILK